jgi:nitroreductase/FMN reductase [NAD(P)H]
MQSALDLRFGDAPTVALLAQGAAIWERLASRGATRHFLSDAIEPALLDTLCALALSSPSKSDLQQRDILIVENASKRQRMSRLLADQEWIRHAPCFLIFLGNNRRQRQVHGWRGHAFANDHLDAFFNATVDASISLAAFVLAAEAAGLGCCPVSGIRNSAQEVSDLFNLPDHVFPVAGLALGWPAIEPNISARLPLAVTVHRDRYTECTSEIIKSYDMRRNSILPYPAQRNEMRFGLSPDYGWSEEKARQYADPERSEWGAFVKSKGFNLD